MKQLILFVCIAITFSSCTISREDIPEQPVTVSAPYQKCQSFDLETKSGFKYAVYTKVDSLNYTTVDVLDFNSSGIVVGISHHILSNVDVKSVVYNKKCYPSTIQ